MQNSPLINLAYLAAAVLFIVGLRFMSHPRTAMRGNLLAASGMTLAIAAALFSPGAYVYIAVGAVVGGSIGAMLASTVKMTAMPQMVALLNGFGGAASACVAFGELLQADAAHLAHPEVLVAMALSTVIGSLTFWGSLIAYGKLEEYKWLRDPFPTAVRHGLNIGCAALTLLFAALTLILDPSTTLGWSLLIVLYIFIGLFAAVLGVTLTLPIGGADMPVVIALLNSYSGLAAAATGFVIDNHVLIISGSLVGASGILLSRLMCKAMNRSLLNVLFGGMGSGDSQTTTDEVYATVRSTTPDDVAMLLEDARRVVVVPGYGLAVAQAQHAVRDLAKLLEDRGAAVEYAIHPVAGRMPGHMNILLAEADIPYEKLKEMEQINPTLETVDVAIVIGANDVVNPVARTDPKSPIAGMPIIDVDKCRTVIVIKRSLSPGFAGIPNPLFALPNTLMLYGDGQEAVLNIVRALKSS